MAARTTGSPPLKAPLAETLKTLRPRPAGTPGPVLLPLQVHCVHQRPAAVHKPPHARLLRTALGVCRAVASLEALGGGCPGSLSCRQNSAPREWLSAAALHHDHPRIPEPPPPRSQEPLLQLPSQHWLAASSPLNCELAHTALQGAREPACLGPRNSRSVLPSATPRARVPQAGTILSPTHAFPRGQELSSAPTPQPTAPGPLRPALNVPAALCCPPPGLQLPPLAHHRANPFPAAA